MNKISDVNMWLERCDLIITRSFAVRANNYCKLRLRSSCRLYVLPHDTGHLTLLIRQILAEFNTVRSVLAVIFEVAERDKTATLYLKHYLSNS